MLQQMWPELRHAVRVLWRKPLLTLGAVLVLALGIGPLTAVCSLINATLFRPWQVDSPESLGIIHVKPSSADIAPSISVAEFRYLQDRTKTLQGFAAWMPANLTLNNSTPREVGVPAAFVNASYFRTLRVGVSAGRDFLPSEEDYGAPSAVAIISARLWRSEFGADPNTIGTEVRVNDLKVRLVGVAATGFVGVERRYGSTDLWLPIPTRALFGEGPPNLNRFSDPRGVSLRSLSGRLSPDVSRTAAAAELSTLNREFRSAANLPVNDVEVLDTRPLSSAPPGALQTVMSAYLPLVVAVVLLFLLACANVSNLMLANVMGRERDIAIRLSLGSSRARIVGQLLAETSLISAAAAVVGLAIAFAVPYVMVGLGFAFSTAGFERLPGLSAVRAVNPQFYSPNITVWLFALLIGCVTTALAALAPALQVGRRGMALATSARPGTTARHARVRVALLVSQVGVTMSLLVGALTLARASADATRLNPGFTSTGVQVVSLELGQSALSPTSRRTDFFQNLVSGLATSDLNPVAFSSQPPLSDSSLVMMVRRPEEPPVSARSMLLRNVSSNYFSVLGMNLIHGRTMEGKSDIVINETAAKALWPDREPVGQLLRSATSGTEFETCQVVGVVRDTPTRSMSTVDAVIYRTPSWVSSTAYLYARSAETNLSGRMRAFATTFESDVRTTARPMSEYVKDAMVSAVVASRTAWAIGAFGLLLAVVGASGLFAHEVEKRRHEIGIRRALGADNLAVSKLLTFSAARTLMTGVAIGCAVSFLTGPLLSHYLYGLGKVDFIAYVEVAGILAASIAAATLAPARRAVSVDPAKTLRGE